MLFPGGVPSCVRPEYFQCSSRVKPVVKWIAGAGVLALAAIQLFPSGKTNPAVVPARDLLASNTPPAGIAATLHNACYDCHSYETKWPWYSRIAPVSWWLADHVNEGRQHLNFSDWPHDNPDKARKRWNRVRDEVSSGDMPLPSYTWAHPESRLSSAQREQLAAWADKEAERLKAAPDATHD
jgi:hypothetical protein